MTSDRPFEILHLPARLRTDFTGKLAEATSGDVDAREGNFLTRALSAFAVHKICGCTLDEAAQCVVDGGNDGGVDAVYFLPATNTLWLIQSKFIADGRGQPALADVARFKTGVEQILQAQWDEIRQNSAWSAKIPALQSWMSVPDLRVRLALVYSGISTLEEDRLRLFEDLSRRFNHDDDYVDFKSYSLVSVHDWLTGADSGAGVERIELDILYPAWFREPYETIYGKVRIKDLIALYRAHGKQLIAANIRRYKGNSDVNARIQATAKDEPENVFYLNNGLTAYCARLEVSNLDRDNHEKKSIKAIGFSVVNGAQTLGSLDKAYPAGGADPGDGFAFIKIISLERCEDDQEFARRITECTNMQNQIGPRDFAAIDEQQERIETQLRLCGVEYHYKYGEDTPPSDDNNFTLDDATIALACLDTDPECDLCSRIIGNRRRSLWSFDPVYADTEVFRSRCERIFKAEHSARTIWRAVQAYSLVLSKMQEEGRAAPANSVRKAFFENGRWLVLKILFVKLHPERGEDVALSAAQKTEITAKILEISEALWTCAEEQGLTSGSQHFRAIFSNPADCKRLYGATMAKLAAATSASTPAAQTGTN